MIRCANCRLDLTNATSTTESAIYSPNWEFVLCDPCGDEEYALIDEMGTNDIPERFTKYLFNRRADRR